MAMSHDDFVLCSPNKVDFVSPDSGLCGAHILFHAVFPQSQPTGPQLMRNMLLVVHTEGAMATSDCRGWGETGRASDPASYSADKNTEVQEAKRHHPASPVPQYTVT